MFFCNIERVIIRRWVIKTNKRYKKDFYSDEIVVGNYDKLRFANEGGKHIHFCESEAIMRVLADVEDKALIVDIPTGTGRMLKQIVEMGFLKIVAADYSDAMLNFCLSNFSSDKVVFQKEDIYNLSFARESCSCVVCSRFLFHCSEQDVLFRELARVLKVGGVLVIDSISWSPRAWTKLFSKKLGGSLYTNNESSINKLAEKQGFDIVSIERLFMFPTFFYSFFPKWFLKIVVSLEKKWPKFLLTKRVWGLRKK